jgi:aminopeptidase N
MNYPVPFATFALGPFERHSKEIKWDNGDKATPLEFNSLSTIQLREEFVLAELDNAVRNFQFLFGKYPYDTFGAVYHPYSFGQGFATLLTIPNTDRDTPEEFLFMAHETAHQWWGNIILWHSYRDQWLSEGFAEYSGILYSGLRQKGSSDGLINWRRQILREPPATLGGGLGKGKVNDVGPLILGHRLRTRKTRDAYYDLVYYKGALVLRMIHFLLTDPDSGSGDPFFAMMKDFVERYRNKVASTDDFRHVASEHFAKSPIAAQFGLTNLDWFFRQWVYDTPLPSYHMDYKFEPQPDGSVLMTGSVTQSNVPQDWFMPLPVLLKFGEKNFAYVTVAANGASTQFKFRLPQKPQSVELDPHHWVLSEKTSAN